VFTDFDEQLYICSMCAFDPTLASLAKIEAASVKCVLCRRDVGKAIDINHRRTKETFRALLRFHFGEWAYNGHLGGDEISQVLSRPNPIVDHINSDAVEEVCLRVYESGYETPDAGISLFEDPPISWTPQMAR
jgi:hypothetical protein